MRTRDGKDPVEIGGDDGDPMHDLVGHPFDARSAWDPTIKQAAEVAGLEHGALAAMVEAGTVFVSGLGSDGTPRIAYDEAKRIAVATP